jgi:hypothetical protein
VLLVLLMTDRTGSSQNTLHRTAYINPQHAPLFNSLLSVFMYFSFYETFLLAGFALISSVTIKPFPNQTQRTVVKLRFPLQSFPLIKFNAQREFGRSQEIRNKDKVV